MHQPENRRIVVVDDEECIADTLAIIFRESGYDAISAYDGEAALEACRERAPDLLLSDVIMPGMNGIELALLVRAQCPACKVLLFSGLGRSFDLVEQAKRRGVHFEILEKPTPPAVLLAKVATALKHGSPLEFPRGDASLLEDAS